jgi:hypothetical protein
LDRLATEKKQIEKEFNEKMKEFKADLEKKLT